LKRARTPSQTTRKARKLKSSMKRLPYAGAVRQNTAKTSGGKANGNIKMSSSWFQTRALALANHGTPRVKRANAP